MRVAVKKCDDYSGERVYDALKATLGLLGGMEAFAKAGEKVLIKPNLLMPCAPAKAATTHPEVIRAVIKLVREANALPMIGECPGGIFTPSYLRLVYSQCGIAKIAQEENCPIFYDFTETVVESPDAEIEKRPIVASFYLECDKIIDVAKLKTHGFMGYSGAVKNMFGAVPGVYKAQYHLKFPKTEDFAAAIVDIFQAMKPALCIVDGVIGMEGNGPSGGTPRAIGALIAGENGHAVDCVCAKMVSMEPAEIWTLANAATRNLVNFDEEERIGDDFSAITDFLPPDNQRGRKSSKSGKLRRVAERFLKTYPRFVHAKCTGCAICAKNCPPKAISMTNKRPQLDKKLCISCLCCHELCPSLAIDIKRFLRAKI